MEKIASIQYLRAISAIAVVGAHTFWGFGAEGVDWGFGAVRVLTYFL